MIRHKIFILLAISFAIFTYGCDSKVTAPLVQPMQYDFGRINIGDTIGYIIRVKNTSNSDIKLTKLEVLGVNTADFYISGGQNVPTTLRPGKIHMITMTFAPKEMGIRLAKLRVRHSTDVSYTTVELRGTGQQVARISIPETNHDFGALFVSAMKEHTFQVQNYGTYLLSLSNYTFSGTGASDYSISAGNPPLLLHPGEASSFTVKFSPSSVGNKPAKLTVEHNAVNDNPYIIEFTGSGVLLAPELTLNVSSPWDLGQTTAGNTSVHDVKITNTGNALLTINSITLQTGTEFSLVEIRNKNNVTVYLPVSVAVGDYVFAQIEFKPSSTTTYNDKLIFIHDGVNVNSPFELEIKGTGN